MFGERVIGETPATNPKTLVGRSMDVGISDLLDQQRRDFYRISLMIERIDSNAAYTRFNGYKALKEHVLGMVRKRSQKVESVMYVETKDKWRLQVTSVGILNRNTETAVKKKARAFMEKALKESAARVNIEEFVKAIISSNLQRGIKKSGSKVYPIRFFEVAKIEVKGVPQAKGAGGK